MENQIKMSLVASFPKKKFPPARTPPVGETIIQGWLFLRLRVHLYHVRDRLRAG